MLPKPFNIEHKRISLSLTFKWLSLSLVLYFISVISNSLVESKFMLADAKTWMPLLRSFTAYGILSMMAIAFSELASYFDPEDAAINRQNVVMSRLAFYAASGYIMLVPLNVVSLASIANNELNIVTLLPASFICIALAIGHLGATRMRYTIHPPLESWLQKWTLK